VCKIIFTIIAFLGLIMLTLGLPRAVSTYVILLISTAISILIAAISKELE
jgi:hypothetical protein